MATTQKGAPAGRADTLTGGDGDDVLLGGDGADRLTAGAGDDLLLVDNADTFDGGEGWDTLVFTDDANHDVDLQARGVERVFGGDGNDNFHSAANVASRPLYLYGGGGDDVLTTGVAEDFLHGGAGNDTIHDDFYANGRQYDGGERDVLQFGYGITVVDLVMQMSGNDLLVGIKAADAATTTDLSALTDVVRIKDYANSKNKVEELAFSDGVRVSLSDVISTFRIVAGGADRLFGDVGNDMLLGGDGRDFLFGDDGDDVLYGGAGSDWMYGRQGDDVLYGGLGSDTYWFWRDGLQDDTMRDTGGTDTVVFDDVVANNLWLTKDGDDLHISLLDSGGLLTVEDHFAGEATRVESFGFGGAYVNANSVDALVNAMAAFTEPQNGLGDLSATGRATVVAAWQQAGVNLA